ncbi:flap endonuclease GEN-like 1 [Cynara cardunculus var. scolymus]|uniref:flap endonuclease GEN-like 1 n=1 Tax=Cynara cardunculus var. scolymus TaxID=59895 RepID=UPI000D627D62|nr:flap endonuclease GEN-like 1 [Cynara cardunculus var. scolymus]
MGVGGNFWDLLKPYARTEGFDFLRNKRVAIDLSYWIVQHETAIKAHTRNPHLRLTFFRTINLFSKFGAFPVFVADGTPSPLKSQARIMRFLQASGIDLTSVQLADGTSVERNRKFLNCVQECVELLELFGMPVLRASGEAEGLCAQLNREGRVDACITSDSDAFLFGAKCIIKRLKPNSQEPFECYQMSDVEGGLGLKRNHLIAIALLVGNDHDLKGVQGIGIETALSFVKLFGEDEVLDRLRELGSGNTLTMTYVDDSSHNSDVNTTRMRVSHCSLCGHPGSKRSHLKDSCECCSSSTIKGCTQKPIGFTCDCSSCDMDKKEKEQTKKEAWKTRVCKKIAAEPNFPNDAIIQMYLSNNHSSFTDAEPFISWKNPSTEMLVDYVAYKLNWEPSFIRQKLFPLLSTVFLRNITKNQETDLLFGQYEFDFIQRTKMRFGHTFYVVIWKKSAKTVDNRIYEAHAEEEAEVEEDLDEVDHVVDIFDEPDVTNVRVDNGCLTTDENRDLVMAAYPEKVDQFMQEKESKEMKSRKKSRAKSPSTTPVNSSSPTSRRLQLNITQFFRSSKGESTENSKDNGSSSGNLSKSARRRLLLE